jgi:hypothetical protein
MKQKLWTNTLAALLLIAAGCSKGNQTATSDAANAPSAKSSPAVASTASSSLSPEQLGALGAEIKKHPNDAHKLIADHGMTEESFAAAVRKISEDPAAAKRYAAAYKQASS